MAADYAGANATAIPHRGAVAATVKRFSTFAWHARPAHVRRVLL